MRDVRDYTVRTVTVVAFLVASCSTGASIAPSSVPPDSAPTTTTATTTSTASTTTLATTTEATTTTTTVPPTTFAAIGDYGNAGPEEQATSDMIHAWAPDFIVTAGDNTYGSAGYDALVGRFYADYIGDYSGAYGSGSSVNRFFPALGNHDYTDASLQQYLDFFTLPGDGYSSSSGNERYYDVVLGPIHWFFVNSDPAEPDGTGADSIQAAWLRDGLAASTEPWQVVVFHHAPYGSAHHKGDERMRWPFAAWGADMVIAGHNHDYERFLVDGITYVTVGLGRTNVPLGNNTLDPHSVFFFGDADTGALRLTACAGAILGEFTTVGAGIIDSFSIGSGICS
jgi:tartrate-resistant acid phosphatase type 5